MTTLTLRNVKGSPLTNQEMDDNFNNLNVELNNKLNATEFTATAVLNLIKSVDGAGSGLDADTLDGYNQATTSTVNTLVRRDANGDIFAATINGNLLGNVTGNVTGNLTGTVTGNATNVNGTVALANGGTGATTASAARTNLGLGSIATQNANAVAITGGTISGLGTALAIADGGTGANTAALARVALGLNPGSDVQQYSTELAALSAVSTTGIISRTASNTYATRTIGSSTAGLTVTNGDGVSGNPSFALGANLVALNGLTFAADKVPYFTSSSATTTTDLTSYGRQIIALVDSNGARTLFGTRIGTDVQAYSSELSAYAAFNSTGIIARTAANTLAARTLTAGAGISITNGSGVSGNPTIAIDTTATVTYSTVQASTTVSTPSITHTGTSGLGNIGQTDNRFQTVYAVNTTAYFGDLAEKYTTDQEYEPGTVVVVSFDDSGAEATQSFAVGQRTLGVISTNPGFTLNDGAEGQPIALRGRVPVKVVGPIKKGQPLISMPDGHARFGDEQNSFAIALETNNDTGIKLVECVIL